MKNCNSCWYCIAKVEAVHHCDLLDEDRMLRDDACKHHQTFWQVFRKPIIFALVIISLVCMLLFSGCKMVEGVGNNGENFRVISACTDTDFDNLVFVHDPNSGLSLLYIGNFTSNAETGEAGVFFGNFVNTVIKH